MKLPFRHRGINKDGSLTAEPKRGKKYDYRCSECGTMQSYVGGHTPPPSRCHPKFVLLPWSEAQEQAYMAVLIRSRSSGIDLDEWVRTVELGNIIPRPYYLETWAQSREPNRFELIHALRCARYWQPADFYEGRHYEPPHTGDPFASLMKGSELGFRGKVGRDG